MKFILICLSVVLCIAFALPSEQQLQQEFQTWTAKYRKAYSPLEFKQRYSIWRDNYDFVEKHNEKKLSYTVGMNEFADLTNEEFRSIYLGFKGAVAQEETQNVADFSNVDVKALPTTVDWRTKGAVTGVKNQGQCGSCWSFSTTGNIEGNHFLTGNPLVSLSEQNLMDCSTSYGNEGCNGGLMSDAFKYVIANKGIDTESSYPYTAEDGSCHYSVSNRGANITSYTPIASGSESDLQVAVANIEPVSIAIDAGEISFQLYYGGVYWSELCGNKPSDLDHGVLAVGYGVYEGTKYWLVKNSWGASWGLDGYIMMIRDWNNNCGVATMPSYSQYNSKP